MAQAQKGKRGITGYLRVSVGRPDTARFRAALCSRPLFALSALLYPSLKDPALAATLMYQYTHSDILLAHTSISPVPRAIDMSSIPAPQPRSSTGRPCKHHNQARPLFTMPLCPVNNEDPFDPFIVSLPTSVYAYVRCSYIIF